MLLDLPITARRRRFVTGDPPAPPPAPGSFGALAPQTFTEGSEGTYVFAAATGADLTWAYSLAPPVAGLSIVSATRTITFADTLAPQAGTPFTVRALDQFGRFIDQSTTFTIEELVEPPTPVNPDITLVTFTPGDPASLVIEGTYAGADPGGVEADFAFGQVANGFDASTAFGAATGVDATQTISVTITLGEFDESFTIDEGTVTVVTTLGELANADRGAVRVREATNGGFEIQGFVVSGLVIGAWATTGGDGVITVTSQPAPPPSPTVTGGDGTLTITG